MAAGSSVVILIIEPLGSGSILLRNLRTGRGQRSPVASISNL